MAKAKKSTKTVEEVKTINETTVGLNEIADALNATTFDPELIKRFAPQLDRVAKRLRVIAESYGKAYANIESTVAKKAARIEKIEALIAKKQAELEKLQS